MFLLGVSRHADEDLPLGWQHRAGGKLALAKAIENRSLTPITSPVLFISGPSTISTPTNLPNGNTLSLTVTCDGIGSRVRPCSASDTPAITLAATLATGTPVALATNGTVRLARGFTSSTYSTWLVVFALDGVLHVHQPDDAQLLGHGVRGLANLLQDRAGQAVRRDRAGLIARVNAGFFDVLHDAGDDHVSGRR